MNAKCTPHHRRPRNGVSLDLNLSNKLFFFLEPGQLESPRYTSRPTSLLSTVPNTNSNHHHSHHYNAATNGGTTELISTATNSSYVNTNSLSSGGNSMLTIEQLQKDLLKLKTSMDEMKTKLTDQIRDLVGELDEEKKARSTMQVELERLRKLIHKSQFDN
jgi:hypothetical protein